MCKDFLSDKFVCPYCSNKKVLRGYNDLETTNPVLAKEWNYEKNGDLLPTQLVAGSNKKVWWKCSEAHEWQAVINNRNNGSACPCCSGSNAERLIYTILKEQKIYFRPEYKFHKYEKDYFISFYPYDIYIPKENIVIEADGVQHFSSIEFFDKSTPFEERIRRDNLKNQYCKDYGIALLRIPYTYTDKEKEVEKWYWTS